MTMTSAASSGEHEVFDPLSDPEERRVLFAAIDSFWQYRRAAHYNITDLRRHAFYSLPSHHIDALSEPPFSFPATFNAVDDAIDANSDLAEAIAKSGVESFGIDPDNDHWEGQATPTDLDKARSTIKQFYRDWSHEGAPERHASHSPIMCALMSHLPAASLEQRGRYSILVPGAGLGRLVLEICMAGYRVEGNEISYHQLLASNYILNCTQRAGQHQLYPWALGFSNHTHRANQLKSVAVPDVHPATDLAAPAFASNERMSMTAGDFCELYKKAGHRGSFDAVVTCFFIDTAPNVLRYIETTRHCLRPGGVWINLGPLLWHFEAAPTPAERARQREHIKDFEVVSNSHNASPYQPSDHSCAPASSSLGIGEPGSIELSNDQVVALVQQHGFDVLHQKQAPAGATGYIQDPESMLQNVYRPAFWVARKK